MNVPRPVITLLTDFGTDDTYVGQMKGVIARLCPEATMIDLTHTVRPQGVEEGAFLLESAIEAFPEGTVHLAVVDPGVGTERLGLAMRAGRWSFVGPDNGLLSCALPVGRRPAEPGRVPLPDSIQGVALEMPRDLRVAATFHGRDLFSVAAARLARGRELEALGRAVDSMAALPAFRARERQGGVLEGRIVHIDRFGNVITSVHVSQLRVGPLTVTVGRAAITAYVRTYGEGEGLVALIGSSGFLEVAEVNGNAARRLSATIGDEVTVTPAGL
jgi:S-adenosylmethionine hydrolase